MKALRERHQLAIVCSINVSDRNHLISKAASAGLRPDDLVLTGFVSEEHGAG